MLTMVGWKYFIEELSDCDIVAIEILGHSDAVFFRKELCNSDIVRGQELSDDVVEELSD